MKFTKYAVLLVLFASCGIAQSFPAKATNAELVEILDGKSGFPSTKKIEAEEKARIEKEILRNKEEIKKAGENDDFKCESDSVEIRDWAEGSFTRPRASQKAYLYQLCFAGQSQYATYLGGVIITENTRSVAHYIFSGVHGFDHIKTLPDINRNGLNEIALSFYHSIQSLNFANAIAVYELRPKIVKLAEHDFFTRLPKDDYNDAAYRIFAKPGKKPRFYREKYSSEYQESKWALSEELKEFAAQRMLAGELRELRLQKLKLR